MNPKVSIIIPCYNAENFIEQSVMSCLWQKYDNKEIIIVDNESTDGSFEKLKSLKSKFNSLIIDTEKNIYKYSWQEPVEKAWTLMTGDYFTVVGADDLLHEDYISKCVSFMLENNLELLQSHIHCFNKFENSVLYIQSVIGYDYSNIQELKSKLLTYCAVASPSVFYKSDVLKKYKIEFSSDKYLGSCDYHMYCSLVDQGAYIHPANKFLGYFYRFHDKQSTYGMNSPEVRMMNIDNSIRSKFKQKWS